MRFIRQEEIITTICNKKVVEDRYIIRLLEKLKEERLYFSLTLKRDNSSYGENLIGHDKVKVKQVNPEELSVDFYVYTDTSLIKLNNINFDRISEIFALTKKNNLLDCGRDKGFFDFIDLED